jgi:hypothetical protein
MSLDHHVHKKSYSLIEQRLAGICLDHKMHKKSYSLIDQRLAGYSLIIICIKNHILSWNKDLQNIPSS